MAKKKDIYKVKPLNDNKRNIIQSLIEEYDIETAEDIQEAEMDAIKIQSRTSKTIKSHGICCII